MAEPAAVAVLGIRHHGPGSARAVAAALDELRPEVVLVEGAPELDVVSALAAAPDMVPPVAGLVYVADEPSRASFWPLASFSPEWVALRWAQRAGVPARFIDLPAAHQLAEGPGDPDAPGAVREGVRADPIGALAAAAGYADPERWWEDVVEHRAGGLAVFAEILAAMAELRAATEGPDAENDRREAAMRRSIRATLKEGPARVAVVCGAWHAPALVPSSFPSVASDQAHLRGLPKVKVTATWVPWTARRLARASGYGAGVTSPGWYEHLFRSSTDVAERWMVQTATLLRAEHLDAPPAGVIEGVRLAHALAAVRDRPAVGVDELLDATRAVLGGGDDVAVRLVADRLLVGDALGSVPDDTPMVPLARDLAAQQKRLRLKVSATVATLELDLRTPSHLERSRLFWRLTLLGIPWAVRTTAGRSLGTFREAWSLEWRPELAVAVVEASGAGTTIAAAATATVTQRAAEVDELRAVAELVERSLRADLPDAVAAAMAALAARASRQHDVLALADAVEPLARTFRYGDVRRSDTTAVAAILEGMLTRIAIGLPAACASLDDEAAAAIATRLDATGRAVALVDDPDTSQRWAAALAALADQHGCHGLVAGRAVRTLLDSGRLHPGDARRRLWRSLSAAADLAAAAAWLDGFLTGDIALLLHDHELLGVVDGWLAEVPSGVFDDLVPVLRRTFSRYQPSERAVLGRHVRRLGSSGAPQRAGPGAAPPPSIDTGRADLVLPRLAELIGVPAPAGEPAGEMAGEMSS